VGYAVDGIELLLLDEQGQPNPIQGEIILRGEQVALGYWQKPDMTQAAFQVDLTDRAKRSYRTGDLGRLLPDGQLLFLGRKDSQVKVRGMRVELVEIEAVLAQHPAVAEAVVIDREDTKHDKRLVAYLVTDRDINGLDLRPFLKQKLPDYMVPAVFMSLERLPLTPSGKVDRQALPVPDKTRPNLAETFVAPRTPLESQVAAIWAELLQVEQIGVDDNFFELGGHSLLAIQIVSRIRNTFQIEMPLHSLFEAPTIADLAVVLTQLSADQVDSDMLAQLLDQVDQP
jgi:acyl carrier protein